ncbi:lmo0937 family membrane protein [Clostridium botulinum D/C]|nr:lmo0937 family membrane protein [Clostridium botulinum]MCD3266392.1 lmo0937 family membrane protein [Clostridium botulinum D/C]
MKVLHWIGAIVVFFCILGIVFKIGGKLINILLIIAAIIFIYDVITDKRR